MFDTHTTCLIPGNPANASKTKMSSTLMNKLTLACAALLSSPGCCQPPTSPLTRARNLPKFRPSPVTAPELELVKFELVSKLVTTQPFIHHCLPRSVSSSWIRFPCEFLRSWETAGKLWKLLFLLSHPDVFRLEIKTLQNLLVQTSHFEILSYKCFFLLSKIVIPCATQRWGCFSRVLQSTLLRGGQKTIEGRPITRWINCN